MVWYADVKHEESVASGLVCVQRSKGEKTEVRKRRHLDDEIAVGLLQGAL